MLLLAGSGGLDSWIALGPMLLPTMTKFDPSQAETLNLCETHWVAQPLG